MDDDTEVGLLEYLAARARRASDARLALDVGGGLLALAYASWRRPTGWLVLAAVATCFAAYGGWGMADRELRERYPAASGQAGARVLQALRAVLVVLGGTAVLAAIAGVAGLALGTIIS